MGGVAIIDQSICSHARYFIGSRESTFTFRIQEEREIMGFKLDTTFDMLCGEGKLSCEKGTQWKIEWGKQNQKWQCISTLHVPNEINTVQYSTTKQFKMNKLRF